MTSQEHSLEIAPELPAARRRSSEVISELLRCMMATVTRYHPTVGHTAESVEGLVAGTAFFPGGSGLWRGEENGGPLPAFFPERPLMLVGHNFNSQRGYERTLLRRGEAAVPFWQRLLALLRFAKISPSACFFTNALMGIKPGSATGPMPSVPGYRGQCGRFLAEQVRIVQPCAVVGLGNNAVTFVNRLDAPHYSVRHPSNREFNPLLTREERLQTEGWALKEWLRSRGEG